MLFYFAQIKYVEAISKCRVNSNVTKYRNLIQSHIPPMKNSQPILP